MGHLEIDCHEFLHLWFLLHILCNVLNKQDLRTTSNADIFGCKFPPSPIFCFFKPGIQIPGDMDMGGVQE